MPNPSRGLPISRTRCLLPQLRQTGSRRGPAARGRDRDRSLEPRFVQFERDLVAKRADYARARVPEYWTVDPEEQSITVLALDEADYQVDERFNSGAVATSPFLPAFTVDIADLFASAKSK